MMRKILMILLIVFTSCKNNDNKNPQTGAKEKQVKNLIVKMEFKTNVEDVFKISVINIIVDEFQKKNIQIHEKTPPSSGYESIIANFGEQNFSNSIIFNLGKEPKEVHLKVLEFIYGKNSIIIDNDNFEEFLKTNRFLDFKKDNFTLTTKTINGKTNPTFQCKKTLIDLLKKEIK